MIELKPVGYDSHEYDIDGNTTFADLSINNMVIPLGEENLQQLFEAIEEFKKYTFCCKCKFYVYNKSAYRGSCLRKINASGKEISQEDYGYYYSVSPTDSCLEGELKD